MNKRILDKKVLFSGMKTVCESLGRSPVASGVPLDEKELEKRLNSLFQLLPIKQFTLDQIYSCYCTTCQKVFDTPRDIGKLRRCKDCNYKYQVSYHAKKKGEQLDVKEIEVIRKPRGRPKTEKPPKVPKKMGRPRKVKVNEVEINQPDLDLSEYLSTNVNEDARSSAESSEYETDSDYNSANVSEYSSETDYD